MPYTAPAETWETYGRYRGDAGSQASTAVSVAASEAPEQADDPPYRPHPNGVAARAAHVAGRYCNCH